VAVSEAAPKPTDLAAKVPLPQPRPAEAPQREAAKGKDDAVKEEAKSAAKDDAKAPPPPSACRLALTEEIAIAPSIPPIKGPGGCGGEDLVRLEAVVLPDKRKVTLTPAATMRCAMATAVANWVRNDVAPLGERLGSPVTALDNFDSYQCRGRNNLAGAQLSEHGRANALDVHGFKLADGRMIDLTDRSQPRDLREAVLHSVCTHFSTVLGPDSDWYHEDHIHLDLMERRNNYRICQWDVLDPMPKVAPLMPAARPDDAPSRETEQAANDNPKRSAGKTDERNGARSGSPDETEARAPARPDGAGSGADAGPNRPVTDEPAPAAKPADSNRNRQTQRTAASDQRKGGASTGDARSAPEPETPPAGRTAPASDKTRDAATRGKRAETSTSAEKATAPKAPRKRHHSRRGWDPFRGLF
jgi:hypothetical protein